MIRIIKDFRFYIISQLVKIAKQENNMLAVCMLFIGIMKIHPVVFRFVQAIFQVIVDPADFSFRSVF